MGDAKAFSTAFSSPSPLLLITLLLLSPSWAAPCVAGEAGGGEYDGGGRWRSGPAQWEILTKRNFSSQIRLHPHLLLMVTVPWSGESQSLMKEVVHLVADKEEEFRHLKLMVVFRNSEKMLADALGAPEGITLFYYHHSTSYKYQGRVRAQNILSSVYHVMFLQTEEIPLKPLHTQQELENFFQSTDKAVLLLEFCGWSAELLHKRKHEDNKTTLSVQSNSETVGLLEENLPREAGGKMSCEKMKTQKVHGLIGEELTCGIESGLADFPLPGGYVWTKQSDSHGSKYRSDDTETSCTAENFHKFKSFFLDFTKIASEYFLPPERHRFGLISERSLLPFLNVGNSETWLVILWFSGCPNCSMIVHEGDALRTILQTHPTFVKELDADGNLEPVFPANLPSVVLFIDRSSDYSKLRGESKSALQVLRKFVMDNQLSDQIVWGKDSSHPRSSSGKDFPDTWAQIISDRSFQQSVEDSVTSKLVKFEDNMAIMITNKGKSISLDATADAQGNSLYNILSNLLNRKKSAVETKETKISLLAKEVGFQLLSDDFEVQMTDSSPSRSDDSQLNYIDDNTMSSMEDQTSKPPQESNENYIVSHGSLLLDSNHLTPVNDEKQYEPTNTGTHLQQNQEQVPYKESNINKLTTTLAKELEDDIFTAQCLQVNEGHKSDNKEDLQAFTCPAKDVEKELSTVDKIIEGQNIDPPDCSSDKMCPDVSRQNMTDVAPGKDLVGNDAYGVTKPMRANMLDEQHVPFKGSFFFSDGGYQLLRSLTGGTKIPSLVILDPVLQHHYVYSKETDITYSSLVNFLTDFLNGSLTPYQHSASPVINSRESPRPPFVNLDFHEADPIPQVTGNTFCELIVGYKPCKMGNDLSLSQTQNFRSVRDQDVLVLFTTSWCGFCQRMEMVVHEVHRALKNFATMLKSESKNWEPRHIQDKTEDAVPNGLASIFLMDCTLNDCGAYLKPIKKRQLYPALLLFPAQNKTSITYEGDISVVNIIEFLISHGRNSHYLTRHKGFSWIHSQKGSKKSATLYEEYSLANEGGRFAENKQNEIFLNTEARGDDNLHIGSHTPNNLHNGDHHVVEGSVLAATDKLRDAVPFDNATILIVIADENQGFQGMIINKRISWNIFKELDQQLEPLKLAPLFYGGPVRTQGLPLVSLARKSINGYVEVAAGIYFGNSLATRLAIEDIKSGDKSANDFWFFLGYSSWAWNQLFDELAAGAWHLSESTIRNLDWPDR